jgi:hypothetical protein
MCAYSSIIKKKNEDSKLAALSVIFSRLPFKRLSQLQAEKEFLASLKKVNH